MGRIYRTGTREPIKVGTRVSFSPGKGFVQTEEYEGIGDDLNGLKKECISLNKPFSSTTNGLVTSISVEAPDGDLQNDQSNASTTDRWEVLANEVSIDIRQHPFVLAMPRSGEGSLAWVEDFYDQYRENKNVFPLTHWLYSESNDMAVLFRLLISGVTSYPYAQHVLRHTTNVWAGYGGNVSDNRVGRIYSTSSLVGEIGSGWNYPCPPRLISKIRSIGDGTAPSADYVYGWRKLPSTEVSSANFRVDISTEYHLSNWSTAIYGGLY